MDGTITTDSILYLFLFILPGAFSKILKRRFAPVYLPNERNKSSMIETAEIVVSSSVIFLINNIVLAKYCKIKNISEGINVLDSLSETYFLISYIILTLIVTAIFTFLFHMFDKKLLTKIVNLYNTLTGQPKETEEKSLWEDIFQSKKFLNIPEGNIVMSIEKDGQILSRGLLREVPSPGTDCDDFILDYCEEIEGYFRIDSERPYEKRYFQRTSFEYTILSKGITLKFYDTRRYLEFLANPDKTPEWLTSVSEEE